jgi:hypothetical protein
VLSNDEIKVIVTFLNRSDTKGIQEAKNLVHVVDRLLSLMEAPNGDVPASDEPRPDESD